MISVNGVKMTVRQFYSQTHNDQDGDELILIGAGTMKLKDFKALTTEQQDMLDPRPDLSPQKNDIWPTEFGTRPADVRPVLSL